MPQNIDMQDRVVGPLTMVQFLYAVFGAGFAYITINILPKPFSYAIAIIIATLTFCIIFVKINEKPFLAFIGNFFLFTFRPRVRLWSKSTRPMNVEIYEAQNSMNNAPKNVKNVSRKDLQKLAQTIDNHGQKRS